MSKYQEALDNIVKNSCPIAMKSKKSCNECEIKNICNSNAKNWINTLQELIDRTKKEHELLELYRLLIDLEEQYQVSDSILKKQNALCGIRDAREEISQLEEELKVKE